MAARKGKTERRTRETSVEVALNIDGTGKFDVECGIPFLKHMLETLSRYSEIDITLRAGGDDEHHIIEDVAITLGKALISARGSAPIERMSTRTVAMDDAVVMTSVDIIDRPYAEIDCPDPMYSHFLRSLAMSLGMTLHVMVIRGFDDHHIVEATFKSLGLCFKDCYRIRGAELSTKDVPSIKG
ncbi:MAG: imidazoleglycerol-phosphate dehydratase [Thermoplasmatales archaeon]|jgi:imidazoleglycerol-phosphate dehydratase|nr:imidazoleglycerol-phosphate dehydratase [Thermoplasmatales archaeon]